MRNWVFCLLLLVAGFAVAEDVPTATYTSKSGAKHQVFNFDADTIEGDLRQPEDEYLDAMVKAKHSNLIRVREDYREKIMQSAGEL